MALKKVEREKFVGVWFSKEQLHGLDQIAQYQERNRSEALRWLVSHAIAVRADQELKPRDH